MNIAKKSSAEPKKSSFCAQSGRKLLVVEPLPAHASSNLFAFLKKAHGGEHADGRVGVASAELGKT